MLAKKVSRYWADTRRWVQRPLNFSLQTLTETDKEKSNPHGSEAFKIWDLTLIRGLMPQGWYMLHTRVLSNSPQLNLKLMVDYGNGFRDENDFFVCAHSGMVKKRLCFFRKVPIRLRLSLSEAPEGTVIQQLTLNKVSEAFAVSRMTKKLHRNNKIPNYLGSEIKRQAIDTLWNEYSNIFVPLDCRSVFTSYEEWIKKHESFISVDQINLRFKQAPLISIIVPVLNTKPALLIKCIESVRRQTYDKWQLCIVDDDSTNPEIQSILKKYAAEDDRIEWMRRLANGNICQASTSALSLARGTYLALFDRDGELSPHALTEVAHVLQHNPEARVIYSDHDLIDEIGRRSSPHFKPDFNPDLFESTNYISPFCVFQRSLVEQVGIFSSCDDHAHLYSLLLKCVLLIPTHSILHIPRILYHQRITPDYNYHQSSSNLKALTSYFKEQKKKVTIRNGLVENTYRICHSLPESLPLVSLIIPTKDGYEILQNCVNSIIKNTTYGNYEIIIIDNQSTCQKALRYLKEIEQGANNIRVLKYDKLFNYSSINNFGVKKAKGSVIGLLNNDTEVISREWLHEMVSHAIRPEIGCVGAKLYYSNGTVQHAGVILGVGHVAAHAHRYFPKDDPGYHNRLLTVQNYSAVTAACLVVQKYIFEMVGGLNERDLPIAYNDVDFCLRVQAQGFRNLWTPHAELYHHESISRGSDDTPEKTDRYRKEVEYMHHKWSHILDFDPAYNPNLTRVLENFSFRAATK